MTGQAKNLSDIEKLKGDIFQYVWECSEVTFAELARKWPEHFKDGNLEFLKESKEFSNIVLWSGLSDLGYQCLIKLINHPVNEFEFKMTPAHSLTYFLDGMSLQYPLAKSIRHYKKPHWLPCVFNVVRVKSPRVIKDRKRRCTARTLHGRQCKNPKLRDKNYCLVHRGREKDSERTNRTSGKTDG